MALFSMEHCITQHLGRFSAAQYVTSHRKRHRFRQQRFFCIPSSMLLFKHIVTTVCPDQLTTASLVVLSKRVKLISVEPVLKSKGVITHSKDPRLENSGALSVLDKEPYLPFLATVIVAHKPYA